MLNSWVAPYRPFDVEEFLRRVKSPRLRDMPDFGRWIGAAAQQNDIRAEWLLKVAQQEQSFVKRAAGGRGWQRALDFTMGYGALDDGTDLPQYRGVRTQVFASAAGIRGYLTPGAKYDVTDWPGTRRTYGGETRVIRNLAEAVCLRYTPHWSTLTTCERIWQMFDFEDGGETMKRQADVAAIAEDVIARVRAGQGTVTIGGAVWSAAWRNYCSRFVRLCHCAVTGSLWPGWAGAYATWTERGLRDAGCAIEQPVRGCIVALNGTAYATYGRGTIERASEAWMDARPKAHGHVAIYLGDDRIAENGAAGYRIRTLAEAGRERITGYYAPLPIEPAELRETLVVLMDPAEEFGVPLEVMRHEDGRLFVEARAAFESVGYAVHAEHLATMQRVYVKPTAETVATARRIAGTGGD